MSHTLRGEDKEIAHRLELKSVTVKFGGLLALNGVSLQIEKNAPPYALIGPNGAGKTTVFNVITGVYRPALGSVTLNGQPIVGAKPEMICRKGIARTFQNIRLFKGLTVRENLLAAAVYSNQISPLRALADFILFARVDKVTNHRCDEILERTGLQKFSQQNADALSYGDQRKLEIARALMTTPHYLLLDEPAAGMNPTEKNQLADFIGDLSNSGIGILLIEHDISFVSRLCSLITVLDYGEIIAQGSPADIQSNPKVIEAYLGVTETPTNGEPLPC